MAIRDGVIKKTIYTDASLKQLKLKPDPQHRLYKFQLQDGTWFNLPNQIYSEKHLLKYLIKYQPLNVFSSVSTWLNPVKIESASYLADRLFQDSLLYIDIDSHNKGTLRRVRKILNELPFLEEWDYGTSGHGFYVYHKIKTVKMANPEGRYEAHKKVREFVVNRLKDVDVPVCIDLERVSREIGTYNDGDILCQSLCGRLKSFKGVAKDKIVPHYENKQYKFKFVTNIVEGVRNRYVPILKLSREINYHRLMERFNLKNLFVFKTHKELIAVSLTTVDKNRVRKIMKYANSGNLNAFDKYGCVWMRTSKLISGKEGIDEKPRFYKAFEVLDNSVKNVSNPHAHLVSHLGFPKSIKANVGVGMNTVYVAEVG